MEMFTFQDTHDTACPYLELSACQTYMTPLCMRCSLPDAHGQCMSLFGVVCLPDTHDTVVYEMFTARRTRTVYVLIWSCLPARHTWHCCVCIEMCTQQTHACTAHTNTLYVHIRTSEFYTYHYTFLHSTGHVYHRHMALCMYCMMST